MSTVYTPPAIPLAPAAYDQAYINATMRVLVQHLDQVRASAYQTQTKAVNNEVMLWLS